MTDAPPGLLRTLLGLRPLGDDRFEAVTVDDVTAVAREVLSEDRLRIAVVGPFESPDAPELVASAGSIRITVPCVALARRTLSSRLVSRACILWRFSQNSVARRRASR